MRRISVLVAAAAAFGLSPLAGKLDAVLAACLLVVLGVALAFAASGTLNAIAAAGGALGAFGLGLLLNSVPAAAGALLVAFCFSERTLRVRTQNARVVHVALALAAGAGAGWLGAAYADGTWLLRAVVVVVSAVLVALPLFVEADDPLAHALDELADDVPDPSRSSLREAAQLRRSADDSLLEASMVRDIRGAWRTLLSLAQARARLENRIPVAIKKDGEGTSANAVVTRIDDRIAEHVSVLTRAYTAADTKQAAEKSLDDAALRTVDTAGESLEEVSKTLVEGI